MENHTPNLALDMPQKIMPAKRRYCAITTRLLAQMGFSPGMFTPSSRVFQGMAYLTLRDAVLFMRELRVDEKAFGLPKDLENVYRTSTLPSEECPSIAMLSSFR